MDDILDSVLDATEGGPQILGERHDVNQIAVEEGAILSALRGRSGGWDASEYGITAEQAAQMLREADTPEARARVVADLKRRAIRRAGLDTSNGKVAVMVAGEAAWHKLGVNVAEAVSSKEAIAFASLDWRVEKVNCYYDFAGVQRQNEDVYALVRTDTGAKLSTVGSKYAPIQNQEAFGFLDDVLAQFGARYATAGSLYGGKKVWVQAEFPRQAFTLAGGDEVKPYVMFSNAHGGEAAWCYPTEHRVVCANTQRIAFGARDRSLCIRHTGDVGAKVGKAQEMLGLAVRGFEDYQEKAEALSRSYLDVETYAPQVLDAVLGVTAAEQALMQQRLDPLSAALAIDAAQKRLEKLKKTESGLLEDILERYHSGRCEPQGSAWAAYNAVSETADHGGYAAKGRKGTAEEKLSRQFESVIAGEADQLKQVAYQMALASV